MIPYPCVRLFMMSTIAYMYVCVYVHLEKKKLLQQQTSPTKCEEAQLFCKLSMHDAQGYPKTSTSKNSARRARNQLCYQSSNYCDAMITYMALLYFYGPIVRFSLFCSPKQVKEHCCVGICIYSHSTSDSLIFSWELFIQRPLAVSSSSL